MNWVKVARTEQEREEGFEDIPEAVDETNTSSDGETLRKEISNLNAGRYSRATRKPKLKQLKLRALTKVVTEEEQDAPLPPVRDRSTFGDFEFRSSGSEPKPLVVSKELAQVVYEVNKLTPSNNGNRLFVHVQKNAVVVASPFVLVRYTQPLIRDTETFQPSLEDVSTIRQYGTAGISTPLLVRTGTPPDSAINRILEDPFETEVGGLDFKPEYFQAALKIDKIVRSAIGVRKETIALRVGANGIIRVEGTASIHFPSVRIEKD